MLDRILKIMREKVRTNEYIMTLHAEEEMDNDDLTIFDIERSILNGIIIERNRDSETKENKYTIMGESVSGCKVGVITKISITGKLVVITVYKI